MLLAYLVAGLTATVLVTAVGWFWKQCFENADPVVSRSPEDGTPPTPDRPVDDLPAADSSVDGTPPTPDSTLDSPADAAPPAPHSTLDGAPATPEFNLTPPATDSTPDGAPTAPAKTDVAPAPAGIRWSWRTHRQSGLEFLRVTVTNPGPNPLTVTGIGLRTSDELARHADPPAALLGASEQAVELFGQDSGAAPLPHTLEPDGTVDAYFPCRDVADWLYGVAESHNIDRNECHLTPECIDGAGDISLARRKVDYERWLRHGHGPSLREHADGRDSPSGGDDA